jgi:hypothetical protein
MFSFEPISGRPSTGFFDLSDSLRERMFLALGSQDTVFGLRYFDDRAAVHNVALFDARRLELQKLCEQIGRGARKINDLSSLFWNNTGCTINSPRSFHGRSGNKDPFEEISDLFLKGLNLKQGGYPEVIYTTLYLGKYKTGFGLHSDIGEDTTLFVLDGTKRFVVVVNDQEQAYTIEKNGYLAWGGGQPHSAANNECVWSMTINFAVGSPGVAGPVRYCSAQTKRILAFDQ